MRKPSLLLSTLLASTALVGAGPVVTSALAQGLPTGGRVVSGGVTIGTPSGGALAITQSSQNAIVNWRAFSIGQPNRVDIVQPNSQAAILNRVTGQTRSTIAGQLNANGQVYLVNPNGITITRTGRVNAGGGFVASTLGISDEDFKAGRRQFRGSGASASVTNRGTITVGRGGYAALIGGEVSNRGTISVPMGKVGLGSGERATLDLSGDGFLQVQVPTDAKGRGALVRSSGTISADGGSVTLTAAAARTMAREAVNLSGTIEARSVSGRSGSITLSGGEGTVRVAPSARIDASGAGDQNGGRVRVTARQVDVAGSVDVSGARGGRVSLKGSESLALSGRVLAQGTTGKGGRVTATAPAIATHAALIDASGTRGGGSVKLGGGYQGGGRLAHARTVDVDAATTIRADATARGTGGTVVLWSDVATRFAGTISARGGAQGGDGGQAEVSSKGVLAYDGTTILTAARGAFGTLLLDPYNITISNGNDANSAFTVVGGIPSGFTAAGNDSVINAGTLLTALGTANITVSTGTGGSQAGTITLASGTPLSWSSGATLTLQAAAAIALNSAVTAGAGGLTLSAGGTITASADVSVARFTLASGDWVQNAATLPGFAAGDFQVTGGSFLRAAGGNGSAATPYLLTDIYGVQGMGTSADYRAASYRLATDVNASGTAAWNGGLGFSPVGTFSSPLTGGLDGAGHTITGLTIARPSQDYVGLIGYLGTGGNVNGLGLVGGSVSGRNDVGGLVGSNSGGNVRHSYASGSITGKGLVGGLVGTNNLGTVSQSYAAGSVSGSGGSVGGLVGRSLAVVSQSYATGNVSGSGNNVGGLVGENYATVSQSYASGSVSGADFVGGLVGQNLNGMINQSYASGSVSGADFVGGLVGYKRGGGTITTSYWDTQSTGQASGVGGGTSSGATGLTTAQARTASSYAGWDFSTVWYQAGDLRPILRSEAAATVNGVIPVSNLHQLQLMGANLSGSYVLTRDLDASATAATAAASGVFGAGGFVPVGTSSSQFTGGLSGAGHTITGLTIARPGQDLVGLIGYLGTGGSVSGLGLVGGSVSGSSYMGSLVGYNLGTVSRSYASGSVSGSFSVGGLVGLTGSTGTVSQSYATGSVSGSGNNVGGLVGWNNYGTVSQSYASGSVSGSSLVGGLVGDNNGTVSQSYASGSVSGSSQVGGLVGYNYDGTVSQSYATGRVSGSGNNVGGLVGYKLTGTIAASYWDTQSTGQASGVGSGSSLGATGLTTTQARTSSSYAGWDFSTVWYQAGDLRPILRSEAAAAVNGVIPVSNLHQLQLMGANLSGSYVLTRDLDASATAATAAASGVFGAGGFVPVGTSSSQFTGGLSGAGHTITGLTIARPGQDSVGLIGYLGTGGSVSGLGLVGGSVAGRQYVGGLVGRSLGTVSQSYATGSVSGSDFVGGLVGYNGGTVSESYATGSVSGSAYVGGLVGSNPGTVGQSYATGSVSGNDYVGGLVGYNNRGTVSQAYATGSVSGSGFVGGLVGENYDGTVSQSYATGSVSGNDYSVGGLVGGNNGRVSQSYATGSVSGSYSVGGLVGYNPGTVSQSYATGSVSGFSRVGGLVGLNDGVIAASYWDTQSTGRASGVGSGSSSGATGLTTAQMQDLASFRTTYAGFDFDSVWAPPNQAGQGGLSTAYYPQLYALSTVVAVTPVAANRVYGDANPTFTARYAGVRAGDFVTTPGTLSTSATAASNVGTYAVTAGGTAVTGAADNSYRIVYVPGALSVAQRPVTVTADAKSRVYGDDNPALTYTTTSLGAGAAISGALATTAAPTSPTGAYTITQGTLTAAANPNYALTYNSANLTVGQRPVTVTADAKSRVYGDNNPTLTYTTTSLGAGAAISGAPATTAAPTSPTGAYTITQGTLTAAANPNYALTYNSANLTVGQRPVTVTADAKSRVYGDDNPTLTYTTTSLGAGAAISGALATTAAPTSPTGAYTITQGTLTAAANPNYALTYNSANLTVGQRPVTVTADAKSRVYGDNNPALTYTTTSLGAGAAISGAPATTAAPTSPTGAYTITQGTLTAAANPNYALTYNSANLTVGQRPVTVTADAKSRVYGDNNPALTYTTTSLGAGAAISGALATTAAPTSPTGAYTITQGTLTAAANPNYALTYNSANLTVGQRPVTVTADAKSRVYGDNNPALTYTTTSLGAGAAISGALATTAAPTSPTGAYTITQGTLTAAANPNYAITYQAGVVIVTPRMLTVTADARNRIYGDPNPSLTYTVGGQGLVNGDTLTGGLSTTAGATSNVGAYAITQGSLAAPANYAITAYQRASLTITQRPVMVTAASQGRVYGDANAPLTYTATSFGAGAPLSGSLATAADPTSSVGAYAITQGTLTAAANPNYAITYQQGAVIVVPRPITVTADAQNRVYGDANVPLTYTVGGQGLVAGDSLIGTLTTPAGPTSGVGAYAITQGSLAASTNYAVSYQGATLTIGQRPVTVTALSQSRVYGDANAPLAYTTTSLGADAPLSGSLATAANATSGVGFYPILPGTLTAAANPNYAISYRPGSVDVTPRPITIAADAQSRAYGDANSALTYTLGGRGLVNGDALTGGLVTAAGATSNVGAYAITQGSLAASANYTVSYVGANLTLAGRPITVTADVRDRVYGDANPSLTYQVDGRGLVNGDQLTGGLATAADAASNVGAYAITQGSLAASGNYTVSYAGANLTVAARPLTVTADAQGRVYGDANPSLTYQVGGRGLANGDALTGSLATAADTGSNVGSYAITQSDLAASGNYAVSYVGADLTVAARPLTVTADAQSRVYGDANPGLTYTAGGRGLANGDSLTGTLATGATTASNVGAYAITQGSLATSSNYALTYVGSNLTVAARPITITANAQNRIYGDANSALTYALGGRGLANSDQLSGGLTTAANPGSGVSVYAITQGSLTASTNYAVSYVGANLTVAARPITVTAIDQRRPAFSSNPALTYTVSGAGLMNGDTLAGTLLTQAGVFSLPGRYTIDQGSLDASANYTLTFVPGVLSVGGPTAGALGFRADTLGSTVVRQLGLAGVLPASPEDPADSSMHGLSLLPDLNLSSEGFTDPRFGGIVVCLGVPGGCFSLPASRLPASSAMRPQAAR